MAPRVEVLPTAEDALRRAVEVIGNSLRKGARSLALAGGSTPRKVYEALGLLKDIPWPALSFYFGDERCVGPDDPDSNFRMAKEAFAAGRHVKPEQFHRVRGELPDREEAAREYERELPATLDLVLLGVGEDGHTASLFPGSQAVEERTRRVVPIKGAKPPPWRLTVTPPVLDAAKELLVLALGEGKAEPVARALAPGAKRSEVPASIAARDGAIWILDRAAAAGRR